MNAAVQLYMDGLGYLVNGSKGRLLHECINSVVHGWSGSFCNGKKWTTVR